MFYTRFSQNSCVFSRLAQKSYAKGATVKQAKDEVFLVKTEIL